MFQGEGSNSSSSVQDEPSSSQVLDQRAVSLASLQAILREREREIVTQRMESERFLKELQESVDTYLAQCQDSYNMNTIYEVIS